MHGIDWNDVPLRQTGQIILHIWVLFAYQSVSGGTIFLFIKSMIFLTVKMSLLGMHTLLPVFFGSSFAFLHFGSRSRLHCSHFFNLDSIDLFITFFHLIFCCTILNPQHSSLLILFTGPSSQQILMSHGRSNNRHFINVSLHTQRRMGILTFIGLSWPRMRCPNHLVD